MDPLTHAFSGWAVSHLVSRRKQEFVSRREKWKQRLIAPFCMICAMSPDLDILFIYFGPEATILYRRALTHSIFFLPVLAGLLFFVGRGLFAGMKSRSIYLLILGLCSLHVGMDLVNSYGTQVLFPLSTQRFAWDLIYIVDPFWMMSLFCAGLLGSLPGQPRRWLGQIGLAVCLLYPVVCWGARAWMEQRVLSRVSDSASLTILPDAFSPWYWKLIVSEADTYQMSGESFGGIQTPSQTFRRISKEEVTQWKAEVPFLETYFWFNRFPAKAENFIEGQNPETSVMRVLDLRFLSIHPWLASARGAQNEPPFFADLSMSEGKPVSVEFQGRQYSVKQVFSPE